MRRSTLLWMCLLLTLTFCLSVTPGCTRNVERIVYVGYARPPEADGAVRVATSEPIPVTVEGLTDHAATLALGGWYVISPADLAAFVDTVKKYQAEHASK